MTLATVFVWLAFLAPLIGLAAPKGLAPLLAVAVVAVAVLLWRDRRLPEIPLAPALLFGGLVAWGLVSLIWSLEPARGLATAGKLTFMSFGGLLIAGAAGTLHPDGKRRVGIALCIGTFAALALLGEEVLSGGAVSNAIRSRAGLPLYESFFFNAGTTVLAVLLWPALVALRAAWGGRGCAAGLVAGTVVLTTAESATAAVAVAVGALVAIWGLLGRGAVTVRRLLVAGVLIATLSGPAYSVGVALFGDSRITSPTVSSMMHRLFIWDFSATRIREKPFLGWGLESSKSIPGGHTARPVDQGGSLTEQMHNSYKSMLLPLHPHNAGLQVWLELGLPGILLFVGFLVWVLHAIGRRIMPAVFSCLCLAQFVTTFGIAELAYGIWQSWWLSTIAIGAALMVALLPGDRKPSGSG